MERAVANRPDDANADRASWTRLAGLGRVFGVPDLDLETGGQGPVVPRSLAKLG